MHNKISFWGNSILHSYAQVFFSKNRYFAGVLLLTTFFDPWMGVGGVFAIVVTNATAVFLGYKKEFIESGDYSFNSLMVAMGLFVYYQPSPELFVLTALAALSSLMLTVAIGGILYKYGLPYLSLPFLLTFWAFLLASRQFTALGISERGIYVLNELYARGSFWLVDGYNWVQNLPIPEFLTIYFKSLGAIFFQFNTISGLLIALGLLYASRITFTLSLLGFGSAYLFYHFIGLDLTSLSYHYIGFNFILSAIALGGFFLIPHRFTYLWAVLLTPVIVVLVTATSNLFGIVQLGIYSLPFNLVVINFLYILKLRIYPKHLQETMVQQYSPEKNLYSHLSYRNRTENGRQVAIGLPVTGRWYISQAHNGPWTHRGEWRHAWDFVIVDEKELSYRNAGDFPEDYYCYNQPVVAPADGTVEEVLDIVEDNIIGQMDLTHNWGNSIVIKHGHQLYTQISHIKKGTFRVKKGDTVKRGDLLAVCGNSGRSPYPHVHFQIMATPYIGSKTLDYPLSYYLTEAGETRRFITNDYPKEKQQVASAETTKLLTEAFRFTPGQVLRFEVWGKKVAWEVKTTPYNEVYLECQRTGAKAYLWNDGTVHYFTHFVGSKKTLLYHFYLGAYKVLLGYYPHLRLRDTYPLFAFSDRLGKFFQDFAAPFFQFMHARFELDYVSIDDDMAPEEVRLGSRASLFIGGKLVRRIHFQWQVRQDGIAQFSYRQGSVEVVAERVEEAARADELSPTDVGG